MCCGGFSCGLLGSLKNRAILSIERRGVSRIDSSLWTEFLINHRIGICELSRVGCGRRFGNRLSAFARGNNLNRLLLFLRLLARLGPPGIDGDSSSTGRFACAESPLPRAAESGVCMRTASVASPAATGLSGTKLIFGEEAKADPSVARGGSNREGNRGCTETIWPKALAATW